MRSLTASDCGVRMSASYVRLFNHLPRFVSWHSHPPFIPKVIPRRLVHPSHRLCTWAIPHRQCQSQNNLLEDSRIWLLRTTRKKARRRNTFTSTTTWRLHHDLRTMHRIMGRARPLSQSVQWRSGRRSCWKIQRFDSDAIAFVLHMQ